MPRNRKLRAASLEVTAEQVHDVFVVRSRIEGSDDKANYDELFKVHRRNRKRGRKEGEDTLGLQR